MFAEQSLLEQLGRFRDSATVILGIGNILKGDDGAGPVICQKLKDRNIGAEVIDGGTVPENYIHPIIRKAPENLLVIDAIDFGGPPGTIKLLEPEQLSSRAISTHCLSPHLFVDMIRRSASVDVCFIGIQPSQVKLGEAISSQVDDAINKLSEVLARIFASED
jgi:hydrogenase 3 maturation protease